MSLTLTASEEPVWSLVALGYPNEEIAQQLGLSLSRVNQVISGTYARLGILSPTRSDRITACRRLGLLAPVHPKRTRRRASVPDGQLEALG